MFDLNQQTIGMNEQPPEEISALVLEKPEPPICIDPSLGLDDPEVEKRTIAHLLKIFIAYRDAPERKQVEDWWQKSFRAWIGWTPHRAFGSGVDSYVEAQTPGRVTVVKREVFRQLAVLQTKLAKPLIWPDQPFNYEAANEEGMDKAKGATRVVVDQIKRFKLKKEIKNAGIKDSTLYGTGYVVPGWADFKLTRHRFHNMVSEDSEPWQKRESFEVNYNGPMVQRLAPWDLFSDPYVDDAKDSDAVFEPRMYSGAAFKTAIRNKYMDAAAVYEAVGQNDEGNPATFNRYQPPFGFEQDEYLNGLTGGVPVLRCWTQDGMEYIIVNEKKIVRAMPLDHGKIPVVTFKPIPIPGRHWGIPVPMIIMGEQVFKNELWAMISRSMRFAVPLLAGTKEAVRNYNAKRIEPGTAVEVTNQDDLKALTTGALPALSAFLQLDGVTSNDMARATGITDILSGTGTSGTTTASAQLGLEAQGTDRLQDIVNELEPSFAETWMWLYDLNATHPAAPGSVQGQGDPHGLYAYRVKVGGLDGGNAFSYYETDLFGCDVGVSVQLGSQTGLEITNARLNVAKNILGLPFIDQIEMVKWVLESTGDPHPERFIVSQQQMQTDVLEAIELIKLTGLVPTVKPNDNHQLWVTMLQMFTQSMDFGMLNPMTQRNVEGLLAHHLEFTAQMEQANEAMQQAPGLIQPPGAQGPAQQQGNNIAESMIGMGQLGANQQGAEVAA